MRLHLLSMSLLGRVFGAFNARQSARSTAAGDARRAQLLGNDDVIHDQALRTQAFANEVAAHTNEAPNESRRRFW